MDPKIPTEAHIIKNEDGQTFQHEGYTSKICLMCGTEFVLGKNTADKYSLCLSCERNMRQPV